MSQFAFVYRQGPTSLSPEQMQHHLAECQNWFNDLLKNEKITDPGVPLASDQTAVVAKNKVFYDGPFAEAKDVIGGFTLVEAKVLEEAIEIAKTCLVVNVGGTVEVRPVQSCAL